jgi:hypothetical protein
LRGGIMTQGAKVMCRLLSDRLKYIFSSKLPRVIRKAVDPGGAWRSACANSSAPILPQVLVRLSSNPKLQCLYDLRVCVEI